MIFGSKLEERGFSDKGIYFAYVITGVLAGLLSMFLFSSNTISVGASGAVFGILGVNVGVERKLNDPNYKRILAVSIIFLIFSGGSPGTNVFAHLYGLIFGIILGNSEYFHTMQDPSMDTISEKDAHRLR